MKYNIQVYFNDQNYVHMLEHFNRTLNTTCIHA